jgi:hypothetical protein
MITDAGKAQMAELEARRTAALRGERPYFEDPGRFGPRSIGAVGLAAIGWELWTTEDGRRNAHEEPLGGIVVAVDAGGTSTDEWGELVNRPARFRCYDPFALWPGKSFRWLSEAEINREAIGVASRQSLVTAVRRFCREVGRGGLTLDAFEADLVVEASRLCAVLMGGGA